MSRVDDLAKEMRRIAREEAQRASPPLERFKVIGTNPLRLSSMKRKFVIKEGEVDVETAALDRIDEGDVVYVFADGHRDYVIVNRKGKPLDLRSKRNEHPEHPNSE